MYYVSGVNHIWIDGYLLCFSC